jgi:hypothetical protein
VKKSVLSSFILALAASTLFAVPAHATDQPASTAELSFTLVFSVAGSTDSAYTAAFGATSIKGLLNSAMRYNGVYKDAKYANVKFYQSLVVIDPSVTACVQKALTVGAAQLLGSPSSDGRNAQLVMKVTGDVRLNEGNGGYDGGSNLTIVEVRSLRSLACEAAFYIPQP